MLGSVYPDVLTLRYYEYLSLSFYMIYLQSYDEAIFDRDLESGPS